MADERTEAERLDETLDAWLHGGTSLPASGIDPQLLAAFERIRALDAQLSTDPRLKQHLWREMMRVVPAEQPQTAFPELNGRHTLVAEPRTSRLARRPPRSRRAFGEIATTIGLIALLVAGLFGYQRLNGDEEPGQPMAVTGNQAASTPTASGCAVQPREPGTVASLVGTPPTFLAYLPRLGNDPVYSEAVGSGDPVDGTALLSNSEPDQTYAAKIEEVVAQLVACRIYAFSDRSTTDLDGRYWALYSDDYFRRELSGYREAGLPLDLGTFWMPSTAPALIETRLVADGQRVLAIFEKPTPRNPNRVVIFVRSGDRWLVDEVALARMPAGSTTYDVSPEVAPGDLPRLDIGIYDATPPATPTADESVDHGTVCDPLSQGTPVPCGADTQSFGPYLANEFPANTDFTITLYNLGQQPHRFTLADLGIDRTIAPGGSASFVLNAGDGQYLYLIYEGEHPEPVGAGVFTFMTPGDEPDEQPSVG